MNKYLYIFLLFLSYSIFPQQAEYEMRGVWIAVVKNIDWPSSNLIPSEQQQKEIIAILDKLQKNNINSIFFQVRTECDAVYFSDIEPFTQWLKKGDYDPLAFVINEAHKRGMEFHAWFNPFRSVFNTEENNLSANHISKTHPEWNVTYGNQKWLNPGIPEIRDYVVRVIEDVVKRYDIDGVHFDDYFYPYPQKKLKFNDDSAFKKYAYKNETRDDWRRRNINTLIMEVSEKIKNLKPFIKFGVAPFGIWRNKNSDPSGSSTSGSESYQTVFADSRSWLKEGWIDYIAPQIYWNLNHSTASYKELVKWWNENSFGKDVYVGMAVYKIGTEDKNNPEWGDISHFINEIKLNRSLKNIKGNIFYNTSSFLKNPMGLDDSLSANYYKEFALASPRGGKYGSGKIKSQTGLKFVNEALFNVLKKDGHTYKILINLKNNDYITFKIYNSHGEQIKTLISENKEKGYYELLFDAGEIKGNCFFQLKTGKFINTYKLKI